MQANAQYRHLHIVEQAIQRHSMPMIHSDPTASDHQRAHVGRAMVHEYEMNGKAMKELRKSIQVCAVALTCHMATSHVHVAPSTSIAIVHQVLGTLSSSTQDNTKTKSGVMQQL